MSYNKPRKTTKGYILPKKAGGVHRSGSGKVVHFKSAAAAKKSGNFIIALEHGFVPTKKRRTKKKK